MSLERKQNVNTLEWLSTGYTMCVTGYSGLLGNAFVRAIAPAGDALVGISRGTLKTEVSRPETCEYYHLDLLSLSKDELISFFTRARPGAIIHTAAQANVDLCQKDINEAIANNVHLTRLLVELSDKFDIPLVHISTDYVYPRSGGAFAETDPVGVISDDCGEFINIYSASKIIAEEWVKRLFPSKLGMIIRITNPLDHLYAKKPGTAYDAFKALWEEKEWMEIQDMSMQPTDVRNIVRVVNRLILEKGWEDQYPVFNVVGSECISGSGLVGICLDEIRRRGRQVNTGAIVKTTVEEFFVKRGRAPRPVSGGLSIEKIIKRGYTMKGARELIRSFPNPS